jgi:hypothetical protein
MELARARELFGLAVLNRWALLPQCPCKQHWIAVLMYKYDT